MKLIRNAQVFSPKSLGQMDVLIAGNKIIAIERDLSEFSNQFVDEIDAKGQILTPGFVDSLVHITGGGGEGGYATRTPEMNIEEAFIGGVTTVIGALGTDAETRSLENLLAKAYGLEEQGLSVYCYTGSYHFPMGSITESIKRDIMLIERFIGVGEVAIADHRSSQMSVSELSRVASEARVAGMLSGKAGIVSIHVGDEDEKLSLLTQVVEQSDIPVKQFYPTHINRSKALLEAGIFYAEQGGMLDFTTSTTEQIIEQGEIPAAKALALALEKGIDVAQLTMSSDGNASLPTFDNKGQLIELEVGRVSSLHQSMVDAVLIHQVPLELALASITQSPAAILSLKNKGKVKVGMDADINLLDAETLKVQAVFAKGQQVVKDENVLIKAPYS
ncbi:beta-aspartyl-peptidase [Colwellia sp. RSH04]|uniref:beta-aspartyl-peptidase n=1 Tax=Colwellia sp. RSH04 TaxID=2305464 RepID=UPI000E583B8B|nr:beta-aspartyl-peptidase [Colwellia sp. RSH04]RHW76117.1 beta-aspartyl-peptidase [Colwellia sp. RSH04]